MTLNKAEANVTANVNHTAILVVETDRLPDVVLLDPGGCVGAVGFVPSL